MPSEEDPLLPRNKAAPEISYGYPREEVETHEIELREEMNDDKAATDLSSPIRALITLFAAVVGLGLLIALFAPGGVGFPWDRYPKGETPSTKTRVEKILSKNPLIGNTLLDSYDFCNKYF